MHFTSELGYRDTNKINLLSLFEDQVLKNPDAIAIIHNDQHLTYQQLNELANRLCHYLTKKGVKADTLVPICIDRGIWMIVGMLGILKSGGAYVPIDPVYPQDRINYMLEDTEAQFILCSSQSRSKINHTISAAIIEIDSYWPAIEKQLAINPANNIRPGQLAYVIYTSGSTGKPKGVMIEHKNLASFISWCREEFSLSPFNIVYAATSICFDLSVFEIFYTLSTGKHLRILENALDIDRYLLQDKNILINTVPGVIANLLKSGADFSNVNVINMAGEPVPASVVNNLDTNKIEVRNLYGPTEDTTYSTVYRLNKNKPVLIGMPISNTQAYILDINHELCPTGITGEIYLGGAGLARGYLNRPELTNERFINNPFTDDADSRLYKTGDLGRWLADGNIEYSGRIDDQVKIQGYRIELGEIESAIQQSGFASQSVVVAKEDNGGIKRLVAYIVIKDEYDTNNIQAYLRSKLPSYMVPNIMVPLLQLPLTLNGKIDKKALPEVDLSLQLNNKIYTAPRTQIEHALVDVWQKLLLQSKIGIYNDFFELGGYSLQAVQLISSIKKTFKIVLSPKDILDSPNIASLAETIEKSNRYGVQTNQFKSLSKIKDGGSKIPLYIVCGDGGTVFAFRQFVGLLDHDQPVYGFQQPIALTDPESFPDTIESIASKYIGELLIQNPDGPYALSGHCLGGTIAFEMARQLKAMDKEVVLLVLFDPEDEEATIADRPSITNFFRIPALLIGSFPKIVLKIKFKLFLLIQHPKQALSYRIEKIKSSIDNNLDENDLDAFNNLSKKLHIAAGNYLIKYYDGDLIIFYAKEHYYFIDKVNQIAYKGSNDNNIIRTDWNEHARSIKTHEVDGEHSTMFDPKHAKEFAKMLQNYLNEHTINIKRSAIS